MRSRSPFYQDKCELAKQKMKEGYMKKKYPKDYKGPKHEEEFNKEVQEYKCVDGKMKIKQTKD